MKHLRERPVWAGSAAFGLTYLLGCGALSLAISQLIIDRDIVSVSVAALLVLFIFLPYFSERLRESTWMMPLIASLAFLFVDFRGSLSNASFLKYLPVLVIAGYIWTKRPEVSGFSLLRIMAICLFAYGFIGTSIGRLSGTGTNGAFPLILPLLLLVLPIPTRSAVTKVSLRSSMQVVSILCGLFGLCMWLARLGVVPGLAVATFNHERSFLLVVGIVFAFALRSAALIVLNVAAFLLAFAAYPAASLIAVVLIGLLTLFSIRLRIGRLARAAISMLILGLLGWGLLNVGQLIKLSDEYFQLVGKTDNGSTRQGLYEAAINSVEDPIFSNYFTTDITVVGNLAGKMEVLPVHNDYLSITLAGGLVALTLFMVILFLVNGMALNAINRSASPDFKNCVGGLLAGVNSAAGIAFANPVMMNPLTTMCLVSLMVAIISLCRSADVGGLMVDGESGVSIRQEPKASLEV